MRSRQDDPRQSRMAALLGALATQEGVTCTRLPGVRALRATAAQPRRPVVYDPSVVLVVQGRKIGYVGDAAHVYDPDHYLVLSVLLPFECEIVQASPEEPFLALSVDVNPVTVSELLMELEQVEPSGPPVSAAGSTRLEGPLRDAVWRLLECLHSPHDSAILGPQVVREILYRVLQGDQGAVLRSASGPNGFGGVAKALRRIHTEYQTPLDVQGLARTAGMSVSVFHQHFKAVTATSPIQYLKGLRLHKARLLMAKAGFNAKVAAGEVGYVSPSQFSRDFKRYFGASPMEEADRVRRVGLAG